MSKKPVDFMSAMQTFEEREGVQRRPQPSVLPVTRSTEAANTQPPPVASKTVQRSRVGKVSIGVWVDPAVRKQLAQIALDTDKDQADLIIEALNLVFERYGKSPNARV
jgi:hypothetical protein